MPLFLEELTKAVLEEAAVSSMPGNPLPVPDTLHGSLIARLDRLGSLAKEVAQVGAAIGRQFSFELLAGEATQDEPELQVAINTLIEAGLIFQHGVPPQASLLFKHALVQDAAYGTLLRAPRQALHARIADALLFKEGEKTAPEIIAHHLESAGRSFEAIAYWRVAGEEAVRRAANREAIEHFRRAVGLLETRLEGPERWRVELAILSQLGPALMSVHGWSASEIGDAVERASEIGRRLEASADIAPSIANLAAFNVHRCRLDQAEEASADLFRIAGDLEDPEIMLQAHHCVWPVQWHRGRFSRAVEHADAGLGLYEEGRSAHHRQVYFGHDPAVCALALGAAAQWALGYPERAIRRHYEAIALARRLWDSPSLAFSLFLACVSCHAPGGDAAAVFAYATELQELSEQHGYSHFQASALMFLGWALARSGEFSQGITQASDGMRILRRVEARIFMPRAYCLMAEIDLMAHRFHEGLAHLTQALDFAETGDQACLARLHHLRAECLQHLHGRDEKAVEASLRQDIAVARRQQAKGWELPAATSLARLWFDRGRRSEAYELLAPVYSWFTEGFDTPDLQAAKALLDALG